MFKLFRDMFKLLCENDQGITNSSKTIISFFSSVMFLLLRFIDR